MGQEILYCFKCQERVTSADLNSSNALRFGNRVACKTCVPDLIASLSPQERKELVSRVQSPATERPSGFTPRPRPPVPSTRRSRASAKPPWWAIAAIAATGLVVGIILMAGGSSAPPPNAAVPPKPAPRPPEENPRERAAREALAKAKAVPSSNLDAQIAAAAEAMKAAEGTSLQRDAKEMHEALLEMRRKGFVRELAAVDERARVTLQKEEFGAAIAIYEAARPLHAHPEWKSLVEAKVADVRRAVDASYGPLREQAAQARAKGADGDVQQLLARVARWGLAEKSADLEAHLRTVAPPVEAEARPWVPLFDGKSLDFLVEGGEGAWKVENGALVHVAGKTTAAQSKRQFTNGDVRIRFANRNLEIVAFAVRQGPEGGYTVFLDRATLATLEGRDHEILISFRGSEISATLDGKATFVQADKSPLKGAFQFNCQAGELTIKSIEVRDDPLYDELVAWWTFDAPKDGFAPDSSGNRNHGQLMSNAGAVPGRLNHAIQLDGRRALVSVPASPSLDLNGAFSICLWLKPKPDSKARGIVEKWVRGATTDLTEGYFLRMSPTGHVQFIIPTPGDPDAEVRSADAVLPDVWTALAAVYDGSTMNVYLNGKLNKSASSSAAPRSSKADLKIGMGGGEGPHYFSGELDDVRIYNRALTADEVARLAR
jgi:hypothetical protein